RVDPPRAEAARGRRLVDDRARDRVRLVAGAEPLERDDLRSGRRGDRRDARSNRVPARDPRARAALTESTAELRPAQCEIVAEYIEKRRRRIDVDRVRTAVDGELNDAHKLQAL